MQINETISIIFVSTVNSLQGNKQRQGPTLSVRFTEVSVKRESTVLLLLLLRIYSQLQPNIPWYSYINNLANCFLFVYWVRSIVFKPMIGLFTKVPKDFDSLGLSNCFRNILMPLVSNLRSALPAQPPMETFATPSCLRHIIIIYNIAERNRAL